MAHDADHRRSVALWLERASTLPSTEELCVAFERAFNALWRRAFVALGEITLGAVVDRVRYNASERCPLLAALEAERDGLHCRALVSEAASIERTELAERLASMMLEFLTVLGNLTAEILAPALHAELALATRELGAPEAAAPARPERSEDEGNQS